RSCSSLPISVRARVTVSRVTMTARLLCLWCWHRSRDDRCPAMKPLVPEDLQRARPSAALVRAVLAHARAAHTPERDPARVARAAWSGDKATLALVSRGASTPATTTGATWAAPLATSAVIDLLVSLGPASAGSQLLKAALALELGRNAAITVPGVVAAAGNVS